MVTAGLENTSAANQKARQTSVMKKILEELSKTSFHGVFYRCHACKNQFTNELRGTFAMKQQVLRNDLPCSYRKDVVLLFQAFQIIVWSLNSGECSTRDSCWRCGGTCRQQTSWREFGQQKTHRSSSLL